MEIITVSGTDIRKLSPNLNSIELIYKEVDFEINGIDVNTREDTIYWSNGNIKFKICTEFLLKYLFLLKFICTFLYFFKLLILQN